MSSVVFPSLSVLSGASMAAAALCAGLAVVLLVPTRSVLPESLRAASRVRRGGRHRPWGWATAVVGLCLVPLVWRGQEVVFGVAAVLVIVVVGRLMQRKRARAEARAESSRVLEACGVLSSELAAGRSPEAALREAAQAWPGLEPVVRSLRLGADIPSALLGVAQTPGAEDARLIAAAWSLAHRSGEGLGEALARIADSLRAANSTQRVVASELASARATARLLAVLPAAALLLGSGTGGDPWHFLGGTPAGLICLVLGLALELGGLWWIESIADRVDRRC